MRQQQEGKVFFLSLLLLKLPLCLFNLFGFVSLEFNAFIIFLTAFSNQREKEESIVRLESGPAEFLSIFQIFTRASCALHVRFVCFRIRFFCFMWQSLPSPFCVRKSDGYFKGSSQPLLCFCLRLWTRNQIARNKQ